MITTAISTSVELEIVIDHHRNHANILLAFVGISLGCPILAGMHLLVGLLGVEPRGYWYTHQEGIPRDALCRSNTL